MATVLERLRDDLHLDEQAYTRALSVLAAALPVDRPVELTDEILRAAAAGNFMLVVSLLAEEDDPTPEEIAILEAYERDPSRPTLAHEEVKRELGLD